MSAPDDTILHEEELPFRLVRYMEPVLWGVVALFLSLLYYRTMFREAGTRPAPALHYLLLAILMAAMILLLRNLRTLRIRITAAGVEVSFGIFHRRMKWDNIAGCSLDRVSWLRYGGWGIRITRANGAWRWVFNVIGPERVVVSLKRGRARAFAFSTRHPDRVIETINGRIGAG